MATTLIRIFAILLLAWVLVRACDSGAGRSDWPISASEWNQPYPRPPELVDDSEQPLRVGFSNWGLVFVREPSRATIERWVDYVGWPIAIPETSLRAAFPEHTFVVTDAGCSDDELDIDGVRWQGDAFALSADGSIQVVTALNSLELFRESIRSAVPKTTGAPEPPEPPGD